MIFITTYKIRPFLTTDETRELMGVFGTVGVAKGTLAHYVSADGNGGVVIVDSSDATELHRLVLNYTQWVEYDTKVMLTIEEALPNIAAALA